MLHFGTDGVRGRAGTELREADVAQLGVVVAREWPTTPIVIGHDGRESGDGFLAAFATGAGAQGNTVLNAGLIPTPALAAAARRDLCVAVSITASHNSWQDNGVKVFAPGGQKLSDVQQANIETAWHDTVTSAGVSTKPLTSTDTVSTPVVSTRVSADYVAALTSGLGVAGVAGCEVVIDCANGAMSMVAPQVLRGLQLNVDVLHATPNGRNINDACGAMHPDTLASLCASRKVLGIAFDGDGDRLIAVDENGQVVDGDRLIALAAIDLRDRGLLAHNTVVVTSMTNLGFHRAMQQNNIAVVTTDVGDRAVLAAMQDGGFVLGGEQSGHIIHALHATTGDGLLSAILLLDLVQRSGKTLAALASSVMERLPQVLRSVHVRNKPRDIEVLIADELTRERGLLGDNGRIIIRVSGTEPVVRIMVEAETLALANEVTTRLEQVVLSRT